MRREESRTPRRSSLHAAKCRAGSTRRSCAAADFFDDHSPCDCLLVSFLITNAEMRLRFFVQQRLAAGRKHHQGTAHGFCILYTDKALDQRIVPYRMSRTAAPPRLHRLGVSAGTAIDPRKKFQGQETGGLRHRWPLHPKLRTEINNGLILRRFAAGETRKNKRSAQRLRQMP